MFVLWQYDNSWLYIDHDMFIFALNFFQRTCRFFVQEFVYLYEEGYGNDGNFQKALQPRALSYIILSRLKRVTVER